MAKVLVLYYSSWGHMEQMAKAAAEGAREAGATVTIKRAPEARARNRSPRCSTTSSTRKAGIVDRTSSPTTTPSSSASRPAMAPCPPDEERARPDGPLWAKGALLNKVGSVMASTATQHGGQELALINAQVFMQHHGMIIVPLSYAYQGQSGNGRGARRLALRHDDDVRHGRLAPAFGSGAGRRQVPGQARRRDRGQAARLIATRNDLSGKGGPVGRPSAFWLGRDERAVSTCGETL